MLDTSKGAPGALAHLVGLTKQDYRGAHCIPTITGKEVNEPCFNRHNPT